MKTLRIGIASYEDMKARTMAIARGKLKPKPGDPKVWFTSTESFAKVCRTRTAPCSRRSRRRIRFRLQELAGRTGRKASNLSGTLKTMEHYGFVRLHRGSADGSGRKCPINRSLSNSLSAG